MLDRQDFILIFQVFLLVQQLIMSKKMFRDDNDEFMKSFGGEGEDLEPIIQSPPEIPVVSQAASKKLRRYCENASFNMVSEQSDEKSFNSKENENLEVSPAIEVHAPQPKRINWIKQSMPTSRKFSDAALVVSIKRYHDVEESEFNMPCIDQESEVMSSDIMEDGSRYQQLEMPDQKEYEPPEEDPETYYMKKVRLLETKFKQLNLLYENMVMQLKKQNKQVTDELNAYKNHIQKYHPTMEAEIQKALAEKEENMSFMSSSSDSSKKSQDASIPVVSQIIEIKIQGKKLCDMIRDLNSRVRDLEKLNEDHYRNQNTNKSTTSFLHPEKYSPMPTSPNTNSPINPSNKSQWSRKYSIPAIYSRQKKQSFQTTIISGRDQNDSSKREKSTVVCTQYGKPQQTDIGVDPQNQ